MSSVDQIEIAWATRMLVGIAQRGEPVEKFLIAAGISPKLAKCPGTMISVDQYAALYRSLVEMRNDETLGFLPDRLEVGSFALTTAYALGATTLDQAIRRVIRALRLQQHYFTLTLRKSTEFASVTVDQPGMTRNIHPFANEMLLLVYARFFCWLVGTQLPALNFSFTHTHPQKPRHYRDIFAAPTKFDCIKNSFAFKVDALQFPVRRDKRALRLYLENAHANVISGQRFDRTIILRVRTQLQFGKPAWANLPVIANALHMSSSTLQRRLSQEHTSFQALKDAYRREIAVARLQTGKVAVDILAEELGFVDETAFRRAFKNWTGRTPGSYDTSLIINY